MNGWVAFDFDRTLATYDHYKGPYKFGDPIPKMVNLAKRYLAEGKTVKIMTARVSNVNHDKEEIQKTRKALEEWCIKHFGQKLEITCEKDYAMEVLYDDRAVGVVPNEGSLTTDRLLLALETLYHLATHETNLPACAANGVTAENGTDEGTLRASHILCEINNLIKEYKNENS